MALDAERSPLDDPNADFLEATDSVLLRQVERWYQGGNGPVASRATNTAPPPAGDSAPRLIARAANRPLPGAGRVTPRRC